MHNVTVAHLRFERLNLAPDPDPFGVRPRHPQVFDALSAEGGREGGRRLFPFYLSSELESPAEDKKRRTPINSHYPLLVVIVFAPPSRDAESLAENSCLVDLAYSGYKVMKTHTQRIDSKFIRAKFGPNFGHLDFFNQ